eukprot:jgi/Botrbrau1/6026/Bobra.0042s0012.1
MSFVRWLKRKLGAIFPVLMLPIINDISTDLDNPPSFIKAKVGKLPNSFKPQIQKGYPDLKPLTFAKPTSLAEVYEAGKAAALKMPRWTITVAEDGIIEGIAITKIMRFRDDFVFRFKDQPDGSVVVDGRSKSRLGKGDFGANANRIKDFFAAVQQELTCKSKL